MTATFLYCAGCHRPIASTANLCPGCGSATGRSTAGEPAADSRPSSLREPAATTGPQVTDAVLFAIATLGIFAAQYVGYVVLGLWVPRRPAPIEGWARRDRSRLRAAVRRPVQPHPLVVLIPARVPIA